MAKPHAKLSKIQKEILRRLWRHYEWARSTGGQPWQNAQTVGVAVLFIKTKSDDEYDYRDYCNDSEDLCRSPGGPRAAFSRALKRLECRGLIVRHAYAATVKYTNAVQVAQPVKLLPTLGYGRRGARTDHLRLTPRGIEVAQSLNLSPNG